MTKLEAINKILTEKLAGTKEGATILEAVNLAVKAYNGDDSAATLAGALENLYTAFEKGGGGGGGGDSHINLDFSRKLSFTEKEAYTYQAVTMLAYAKGKVSYSGLDLSETKNFPGLMSCKDVTEVDFTGIKNTGSILNWGYALFGTSIKKVDLSPLDFSGAKVLDGFFAMCPNLESVDLSMINAGTGDDGISVNMLFGYCTSLKSVDISNLDLANYYQPDMIFPGCTSLTSIKWKAGSDWFTNIASTLDFSSSPLDRDTIISLFNNLGKPGQYSTTEITLNATTFGYLSDADKKIAEDKGWTVVSAS